MAKATTKKETAFKEKDTTAEKKLIYPSMKERIEMTAQERTDFDRIKDLNILHNEDVNLLYAMFNRLFESRKKKCNCSSVIRNMRDTIIKYHY